MLTNGKVSSRFTVDGVEQWDSVKIVYRGQLLASETRKVDLIWDTTKY